MHRLEGAKVVLEPFEDRHLHDPNYLQWLRDYDVIKTINRADYLRPVSFAEVKAYCEGLQRSPNDMFFAVIDRDGDRFVGTVRVAQLNWRTRTADLGILIGDRESWGRGLGTDALSTVGGFLVGRLGLRRLTAGLMSVNPGMQKVFERLGFKVEGVLRGHDLFEGEYIDHILMGCMADEFTSIQ
ncbi:MAG: GNAT family N-acetyltransferase [Gemmatimonadetes bacterium]|nr:GNAT family N-acetyltransferase [Gemmatimonadota bacterium]